MAEAKTQNNIDLQKQIKYGKISIEDIQKLFEKIPQKYLDDLDIDGDKDFDKEDIQKLISGDFDKNSILGKELLLKGDKISIALLKQIIEKLNKRISKREVNEKNGNTIKNSYKNTFEKEKNDLQELKEKIPKHKSFDFKIGEDGKGKNIKENAEFIEYRITEKKSDIEKNFNDLEKKQGLIEQINTEIIVIDNYLDFLQNTNITKLDKSYESLYKEINERLKILFEKIKKLKKEIDKNEKEIKKLKEFEEKYNKLIENFKKIMKGEKESKGLYIKKWDVKKWDFKENFNGAIEYFRIEKGIKDKASLFPNDKKVKLFLKKFQETKNKKINPISKHNILKTISNNLGEHIKELILKNSNSTYEKYKKYLPKNENIEYFYNVIKTIEKNLNDHGGISYAELKNFQNINNEFNKISPLIEDIINIIQQIPENKKDEILKNSKFFIEDIINNYYGKGATDIKEFKKFIEKKLNEIPILEQIKDKEASEMNSKEAKIALEYTNSHYKELNDRIIFSTKHTLNTIDHPEEINEFQEKLIKTILESNGGEKKDGIGYDKFGNLWGFDKEKGNYLISINDLLTKIEKDGIEKINSKAFASFLKFLDSINSLNGENLYNILGEKNFKKLQKIWKENDNTIAKQLLEKVDLEKTINEIKKFDIKGYNKRLNNLPSEDPQKTFKDTLLEINKKIKKAPSDEERKKIYQILKGNKVYGGLSLDLSKAEIFDKIKLTDLDSLDLDSNFKKIIKEKIETKIIKNRKERIKKKMLEIKQNFLNILEKRFGKIKAFNKLESIINDTSITNKEGKIDEAKIEVMRTTIINYLNNFNKKQTNEKLKIPPEIINQFSEQLLDLRKLNLETQMVEINTKLKAILKQIEELQEIIKKLEEKKKDYEKKIRQFLEKIKQKAKKEGLSLEQYLKIHKDDAETLNSLKKAKEGIELGLKGVKEKYQQTQEEKVEITTTAIKTEKKLTKTRIEKAVTEQADKKGMTAEEFKTTPEGKKYAEKIRKREEKKSKSKIDMYKKIANGDISAKEAQQALDESIQENKKEINDLEKKLFPESKQDKQKENPETQKIEKQNPDNNNIDYNKNNYKFSPETGTISIIENGEPEKIKLNPEEQKLIKENPETAQNIVNFYKFFKELNLVGVWKYRKDFIKSIGDININLEDDSLKKTELVNFGNKLIKFINNLPQEKGKKKRPHLKEDNKSLSAIENELRKFSQAQSMLSSGKTFNNLGEDLLTANLRNLGIIGGACFHTIQFRDILNGKIKNNLKQNDGKTTK